MANFFESSSAIERATGMPESVWLGYFDNQPDSDCLDNESSGEREPTIQTLINLTASDRTERERAIREENVERYAFRVEMGLSVFGDSAEDDARDNRFEDDEFSEICENQVA